MYRKLWLHRVREITMTWKGKCVGVLMLKCDKAAVLKNTKLFTVKFIKIFTWKLGEFLCKVCLERRSRCNLQFPQKKSKSISVNRLHLSISSKYYQYVPIHQVLIASEQLIFYILDYKIVIIDHILQYFWRLIEMIKR